MLIKDRLESSPMPKPLTVSPDQLVSEAVTSMARFNYGSAIVTDKAEKVIGIVTERDILKRLVGQGLDAKKTRVSEIMTRNPQVAREDDEIVSWMQTMTKERFRRLPVVDDENHIKAVITQTDIVAFTWPKLMEQARQLGRLTVRRNYQILLIFGGIVLYTILLVALLRFA